MSPFKPPRRCILYINSSHLQQSKKWADHQSMLRSSHLQHVRCICIASIILPPARTLYLYCNLSVLHPSKPPIRSTLYLYCIHPSHLYEVRCFANVPPAKMGWVRQRDRAAPINGSLSRSPRLPYLYFCTGPFF